MLGRLKQLTYDKRKAGYDVIDLNMGNPNDPTPPAIVEKLAEASADLRNQRYSASKGVYNLRREVARKYKRIWDVDLDPEKHVVACIGSKEGFSHLMLALLGPGDTAVVGDPDLTDALAARFAHLAFEAGPPAPEELARLRRRIEEELAGERRDRLHPKLGWGGLVDIEFLVQRLQMTAGPDHPEVRVGRTLNALDALVGIGALPGGDGDVLREGHRFFRAVEQALRLVDPGTAGHLPLAGRTLTRVARFLGVRERDGLTAEQALMSSWRRHARAVRTLFESHLAEVGTPAPFEAPA